MNDMNADLFKIALKNMTHRRLRSWLTMIGIFIGITAVVALMSLGQGMQTAISAQFESLGADKLAIQPAGGLGPPGSGAATAKLYEDDIDLIKKVRGVKAVTYRLAENVEIEFNDKVSYWIIIGIPSDPESQKIAESAGYKLDQGRNLKSSDNYKIMVGSEYADENNRFRKAITTKDTLLINGKKYDVVGVMKPTGTFFIDSSFIVSAEHLKKEYGTGTEVDVISVQIEPGQDIEVMAERLKKTLRRDRGLDEGKEDFQITIPSQIVETFTNIFNVVIAVIIGIAGISLVVGGVGIMNTMYTAILERQKEIGIMKSIGARNSDIAKIFLFESGILGVVGGLIGIFLGFSLAFLIETVVAVAWQPDVLVAEYPIWLPIGMMIFAFGVGALFGTFPAIQAAKLHPVDALRK